MKKTWKTFGTILGVVTAITIIQQPTLAEENNSFDLNVNALSESEGQVSVLDAQLSVPVGEDVEIHIPAQNESNSSVAEVSVNDSMVGSANVSVVTSNPDVDAIAVVEVADSTLGSITAEVLAEDFSSKNNNNSERSVVDVDFNESLVGTVNAEVLSEQTAKTEIVDVEVNDSPLGDARAEVNPDQSASASVGESVEAEATVEVGKRVDGSVGEEVVSTIMEVMEANNNLQAEVELEVSSSEETTSGIVSEPPSNNGLELSDFPLIGDMYADIGFEQADENNEQSSFVELSVKNDLLNEIEVGVLNESFVSNGEAKNINGSIFEGSGYDLPLVGETHIGVLDEHSSSEGAGGIESSGLARVDLMDGVMDNVSVDVLGETTTNNGNSTSFERGVVDVNADEFPLVGKTHLGVLDEHSRWEAAGGTESTGLAQVDLMDGLMDNVSIDILGETTSNDGNSTSFERGVVEVNADEFPLIGETHVGVLDEHSSSDEKDQLSSEGILNIGVPNSFLGKMQLDVLTNEQSLDKSGTTETQNGMSLMFGNDSLASINLGLLNRTYTVSSSTTGIQPSVGNDSGLPNNSNENVTTEFGQSGNDEGSDSGNVTSGEDHGEYSPIFVEGAGDIVSSPATGQGDMVGQAQGNGMEGLNGANPENALSDDMLAIETGGLSGSFLTMGGGDGFSSYSNGSKVLPKTGGFFDGMLLVFISLLLIFGGSYMRKLS